MFIFCESCMLIYIDFGEIFVIYSDAIWIKHVYKNMTGVDFVSWVTWQLNYF